MYFICFDQEEMDKKGKLFCISATVLHETQVVFSSTKQSNNFEHNLFIFRLSCWKLDQCQK